MTSRAASLVLAAALAALALPAHAVTPARHAPPRRARPAVFEVGADVSSLPQVEAAGGTFRDARGARDPLAILRAAGFTSVRLRLWHDPAGGACGLDSTLALACRARAAGLGLMLDLHYSDTWADPGHQETPAAWRGLSFAALVDSVQAYTRDVTARLAAQGTEPAAVQIGNEIDAGMLWNTARVDGVRDTPAQWQRLTGLLAAAARGVRAGAPHARVVVHVAQGGDTEGCKRFFEHLEHAHLDYDAIAVSFYPWWHGSIEALADNLDALAWRFDRDVLVAETAYPWTLRAFDNEHNVVGESDQLAYGFPATPVAQARFAHAVHRAVEGVPEGRGIGVWWWEPAWISAPRAGSPWENCALFDSSGTLLPAARELAR